MFDKSQITGREEGTEWFSDITTSECPKTWRPNNVTGWLKLAYLSDEQIQSVKTNFSNLIENFYSQDVEFLGNGVEPGEEGLDGGATELPVYWQFSPETPVLKLFYLSLEQMNFVKQNDLHGANLNDKNYLGPGGVLCYSLGRT